MTIDKNTWQKLAKEYPTRAAWVRGLNDLVWGEHEELYSALIELDITDLAPEPRLESGGITAVNSVEFSVSALDTDHLVPKTDKVQDALDKADEALSQSNDALAQVEALLEEEAEHVVHLHISNTSPTLDEKDIAQLIWALGRGV